MKGDFIGTKFGDKGQLTVIGCDERRSSSCKLYKVYCKECSKDPELFGDGYFYSTKSNLMSGRLPCGCSKKPHWTEEQYKIRIKRKCEEYGDLDFLSFSGKIRGNTTKLRLKCNKHDEPYVYESNTISNLFGGRGCHLCRTGTVKIANTKPDQKMIDSFFASGAFKEGAIFHKSERKTTQGALSYWNYTCPVCSNDEYVKEGLCSGVFESLSGDLQRGKLNCRCSLSYHWAEEQREHQINKRIKEENLPYKFLGWISIYKNALSKFKYSCKQHGKQEMSVTNFLYSKTGCPQCVGQNQQECYINGVYDGDVLVALKFGIANSSEQRAKQQNNKCTFEVKQLKVFSFPSVDSCKAAEAACKEELVCGILSKQEMPDGWTETTYPLNLDKIIEIYKRFDGKLK